MKKWISHFNFILLSKPLKLPSVLAASFCCRRSSFVACRWRRRCASFLTCSQIYLAAGECIKSGSWHLLGLHTYYSGMFTLQPPPPPSLHKYASKCLTDVYFQSFKLFWCHSHTHICTCIFFFILVSKMPLYRPHNHPGVSQRECSPPSIKTTALQTVFFVKNSMSIHPAATHKPPQLHIIRKMKHKNGPLWRIRLSRRHVRLLILNRH